MSRWSSSSASRCWWRPLRRANPPPPPPPPLPLLSPHRPRAEPGRRPPGHHPLLQPPEGPHHRAGRAPRPGARRRLRPRRLLGLGRLRHRRLHHRSHRPGAGCPRLRGGQPQLPARPARPLAGPDRRREVRHPLPPRQRQPLPHRPHRNRRLGPERGRPPRGTPRHRRRSAGWDIGAYPDAVERRAGGRRHGGAERPPHHGRTRATAILVAKSFISLLGDVPSRAAGRRPEEGQPDHVRQRATRPSCILDSNNDEIVYPEQSEELAWYLGAGRRPPPGGDREATAGTGSTRVGEVPSESADRRRVVDFFVRTLVEHQPLGPRAA